MIDKYLIHSHLPESWSDERLGDFVFSEKGKKPKNQSATKSDAFIHPYVDIEAFEKGVIKSYADGKNCKFCSENDFLMVWDGSRSGLVGKGMVGALGSTLVRINFPMINNDYAFYFLKSKFQEINTRAKGSGTPHVDPDLLWNYRFPIAPFNEQSRIVEKIEELFSELDSGIESLKKAKNQLSIYRQALLKQAFEGKLTAQWREDNAHKMTSPQEQLTQIQKEREERYQKQIKEWEVDVEAWKNSGEAGKKPTKPKLLKMSSFNITESSKCFSWYSTNLLNMLLSKPTNGKSVRDLIGGFPVLRLTSLKTKYVDLGESKEGLWTKNEAKPYIVQKGDFLLSRGNGSKRLVGRGALVNDDESEVAYPDTIVRLSLSKIGLEPELFSYFWNSAAFREQIERSARTTAGIYKINQAVISEYQYPVISLEEQKQILSILDEKISISESVEKDIELNILKAELLRQSILKKAFSGQLVSQDPEDEPASELLKKIAIEKEELAEKEKAEKAAARNKKSTAKKTVKS